MAKVNLTRNHKSSSLPLNNNKHLCFNISSTLMYVPHITISLLFLPSTKGFSVSLAQKGFFPPHRGFTFSASHTDSPFVGASDMNQVSTVDLG